MTSDVDVLVIGGGPAGLAAATELRRHGVGALLAEQDGEAGGVPRHCGHSPFGMREFGLILGGRKYAERLVETAVASGVDLRLNHRATSLHDGIVEIAHPGGVMAVRARRILLATGIREQSRAQRLLPGTRPAGILTTGMLQDWVFLRGLVPFRRPIIVGSELVTMSAILTCRSAGIRPVAVVENEPSPRVGRLLATFPALVGVPSYFGATVEDVFGTERVGRVVLRHADGVSRSIECDGIILTGRFAPEATLARFAALDLNETTGGPVVDGSGRTSRKGMFAAGNILHAVKTAGHCWSEGRRAGRAIALSLRAES